ncbi:vWA domain-containing protein [Marinicella sp. W31]|uniref:vWA domain-containing protein n=1 Tax=Marinicella sp. W31 TaxID=3023713 RepID=UPI0037579D19
MLNVAWPWLLLLLPLPLLVRLLPAVQKASMTTIEVPFLSGHLNALSPADLSARWWRNILLWLLLLAAAVRPQWVGEPVAMPIEGRDLMLAIDISGSMEEADMVINGQRVDRLTAVKAVAGDFIERRNGDRIGLILFGENAYLQTPLTFDRKTVTTLLNESVIGLAGKATAIGDAIGLAVKKARETENPDRVMILLTDGQNTAGAIHPIKAAELAREEDLTIYTIGVGSDGQQNQFFGRSLLSPSMELDEATLKKVATLTDGRYFRARDTASLAEIYALLDELEPLTEEQEYFRPTAELYYWPAAAFLLALLVSLWWRGRRV